MCLCLHLDYSQGLGRWEEGTYNRGKQGFVMEPVFLDMGFPHPPPQPSTPSPGCAECQWKSYESIHEY